MNAHDILKQKILDTEEGHATGITREELLCIQAKLESLHRELVEAVNNRVMKPRPRNWEPQTIMDRV